MSIPTEFDPTRAETRQSRVAQRLALALAQAGLQGGLQVVYQPQIDLPSGQLVSFEALCCWRRSNIDHLCRLNFDQGLLSAV